MQQAEIIWENDQAISKQFGDIFFSRLGGLEESKHVFLALNELETRFAKANTFQIGELGFGTGLNFILCWQLWLKTAPKTSRLHFVSTELFPMKAEDIRHAHKLWPEISVFSEELIASLPLLIEGSHRLSFSEGRVTLTLLYGEALETLSRLDLVNSKFDCWFLDGFSPQKNPKMWEATLIELVTAFTKEAGTLATYSVAGFLRRNLEQLGWKLDKVPGFAHKRESLKAVLTNSPSQKKLAVVAPWFSLKKLQHKKISRAVVIGAGLAGCNQAYCLAKAGIKVTLIERENSIASKASGNLAALAIPYLSLEKNVRQRFYATAFEYSRRTLDKLEEGAIKFKKETSGAFHKLAPERIKTLASRFEQLSIPPDFACQHNDNELFYSKASTVNPAGLCRALLAAFPDNIETILNSEAISLEYKNDEWSINNKNGNIVPSAEAVIIANSYDALQFSQTSWLPLTKVRGEIVLIKDFNPTKNLEAALCGNSYVIPLGNNEFLIGASYNQVFLDPLPCKQIQNKLFEDSKNEFGIFSKNAEIISSRVGFRASTYDRLPYVGPVPDFSRSIQEYSEYKKGFPINKFPDCSYLSGLFVNLGHGSRGVVSAPICAELLSSMIVSEVLPIEADLLPALLPMRWIIRELARAKLPLSRQFAIKKFS